MRKKIDREERKSYEREKRDKIVWQSEKKYNSVVLKLREIILEKST